MENKLKAKIDAYIQNYKSPMKLSIIRMAKDLDSNRYQVYKSYPGLVEIIRQYNVDLRGLKPNDPKYAAARKVEKIKENKRKLQPLIDSNEWGDVPGYEDNYMISKTGIVINKINWKVLKLTVEGGYTFFSIYTPDKKIKAALVHRTLAEIWVPNPDNCNVVKFKDGDRSNLSLDNLQWISFSDIHRISFEKGRISNLTGVGTKRSQRKSLLIYKILEKVPMEKILEDMGITADFYYKQRKKLKDGGFL